MCVCVCVCVCVFNSNFYFEQALLCLKNDLVSHPHRFDGVG